ncbi:MoaD/ThiS family protein [Aquimarina sp. MMG016]|uniref:MoaD/ThiS family protein n=1 Tax=Aquimarina sp. MMG016 TaxID=2822690 RepID=UPI001B3A28C4|nr:MoaD/ThiS family protein [Aquimarina sp. MMG016]MBQ4821054.1 MoaD/ThiS family protein [Aquimarina sp. MMG016]
MELKILYFGMIAEITNCSEEVISVFKDCNTTQLEALLEEKYRRLKDISFKIAINQIIADTNIKLKQDNEIALLPPFSGG